MHNRGVEGKKAFILPAVAALVLLGLLVLRAQATDDPAPSQPSPPSAPAETPSKGVKAQIREALTAAGDPVLQAAAGEAISAALQPVVDRCRSARPEAAGQAIRVSVEVISAQDIGLRVERAEIRGDLPADLVGCVREGMLGSQPSGIGKTGRFSGTLEYGAP